MMSKTFSHVACKRCEEEKNRFQVCKGKAIWHPINYVRTLMSLWGQKNKNDFYDRSSFQQGEAEFIIRSFVRPLTFNLTIHL